MWFRWLIFFVVHSILHIFAYLIPRGICLVARLVTCRPCRRTNEFMESYIYYSDREVMLIYNNKHTETAMSVFGLMDVRPSTRDDKQFFELNGSTSSGDTSSLEQFKISLKKTRRQLKEAAKQRDLWYSSPLYNGHIGSILGFLRPTRRIRYYRQQVLARDGCPITLDWLPSITDGVDEEADRETTNEAPASSAPCDGLTSPKQSPATAAATARDTGRAARRGSAAPSGRGGATGGSREAASHAVVALPPRQDNVRMNGDGRTARGSRRGSAASNAGEAVGGWVSKVDEANTEYSLSDADVLLTTTGDDAGNPSRGLPAAGPNVRGVVFVLPGLTSHCQSSYICRFARFVSNQGFHCCILTMRGMGDAPLTTPYLPTGAFTDDVRRALKRACKPSKLIARFGHPLPVVAVGFSLGGAVLSKYVGEEGLAGRTCPLTAAITVCAPNNFEGVVHHMNTSSLQKMIYQPNMCDDLTNFLVRHDPLKKLPNVDSDWVFEQKNINRFSRIVHFDQHIVVPSLGYRSLHEYHRDCSPILWLPHAKIPVLAIGCADDPVLGDPPLPHRWRELVNENEKVVYLQTPAGGHVGFLGGPTDELRSEPEWVHKCVAHRLDAIVDYWHQTSALTS